MNASFPPPQLPPPTGPAVENGPSGTPRRRRRRWPLVAGGLAVVAAVALGVVVFAGDGDETASTDRTALSWEEAWRTDLDVGFDPDGLATDLWLDDEIAAFMVSGNDDGGDGGDGGDDRAAIVVLDPASGEQLWTTDVLAETVPPTAFRSGDVLVVVAATDPDETFVRDAVGYELRTGRRVWRERDAGFLVVPVGDVIVMSRQHDPSEGVFADVVVLDAATGDEVFERVPDEGIVGVRAIRSDGIVVEEVTRDDRLLVGLSLDGEERWTRSVESGVVTVPDIGIGRAGGVTVIGDGDRLVGVDVVGGEERWTLDVELDPDADTLVVADAANDAAVSCTAFDDRIEVEVRALDSGDVRWTRSLDDAGAAVLGVSGADLITGVLPAGGGCAVGGNRPYARSIELLDLADGATSWQLADADAGVADIELLWATTQQQLDAGATSLLTSVARAGDIDADPQTGTLFDPATGEELVAVTGEGDWKSVRLLLVDAAPVGLARTDDDLIVFDPADPARRVETERALVLGAGGDVLYLLDVDTIIAIR